MFVHFAQQTIGNFLLRYLVCHYRFFALLGKFLMEVASIVLPNLSFRKHLKHRIWKFPLFKTGAHSQSHLCGCGTDYTLSWKGRVDTAQS